MKTLIAKSTVVDARGSTVMPGLIDSHAHPVFGEVVKGGGPSAGGH